MSRRSTDLPTLEQIRRERSRLQYRSRYGRALRSTLRALAVAAALAVLVATLWLPVLRIYGSSMWPTLMDGQIVLCVKTRSFAPGDVTAFYHGNKLLIKRYVAGPSDWVDIDDSGNVTVNSEPLEEPYLAEKAFGQTNISLPYQVPEGRYFVMGDNRDASVDSRNTAVGPIAMDQVVGKVFFRIWPLREFGVVK
ncbi:MAG: signal peptidase I [Clostridiales bacterium]|nr:signal peptidase I [Clostridiales bacterium]MDY6066614.1 signal peptidase I [Candidatus Faecousia sp.]